jgi:hypothetical protein
MLLLKMDSTTMIRRSSLPVMKILLEPCLSSVWITKMRIRGYLESGAGNYIIVFCAFSKANTPQRRTMVLINKPTKRHMCPVILFLSMALADSVINGVH